MTCCTNMVQRRILFVLLIVNLAVATTQNSISPRQDTAWQNPAAQPISTTQGADYDPHDYVPNQYNTIRIAHAVLMSIVWLILLPIGGVLITVLNSPGHGGNVSIHAGIQMVAFWIFIVAAGMGIWMAKTIDQLHNYHPTIGLIILVLLSIQPATEIANHAFYQRHNKLVIMAHIHLWLGRTLLLVGMIQGGLGFLFAASFHNAVVDLTPRTIYGGMATVAYLMYVAVGIIWPEIRESRGARRRRDMVIEMDAGTMERPAVWGRDNGRYNTV